MDFWRSVPLSQKMNQNLYRETLIEQNWGGVWQSIPINPSAKFSLPVRCLRLIAKAPFFMLGKAEWHKFERHYLDYFMTPTCGYAFKSVRSVWSDDRHHRNDCVFSECKLHDKNVAWDGRLVNLVLQSEAMWRPNQSECQLISLTFYLGWDF